MRLRKHRLVATVVNGIVLVLTGCGQTHRTAPGTPRDGETAVSSRKALNVEDRLCEIARQLRQGEYTAVGGWRRAIGQCYGWGPTLELSDAGPEARHGMRIYQPWAKNAEAYLFAASKDQPVGQVIVKESWTPKAVAQIATDEVAAGFYAERDGKRYKPYKPNELFVMYKDDPATPGTDDGWVYGIVASDGKEVISSGHIKECADCHRQARHDRVFGQIPKAE